MKIFIMLASAFLLIGVGAGAFGAHALSDMLKASGREATYETAVRYQMYHALGLLAVALLSNHLSTVNWLTWAGWLMVAGIIIFSGSLYLLVFTDVGLFGAITPIGGVAFIAAWACVFMAALRSA
ncbi:MAG: DUF423 domain-containing protein [Anaerolineales bacterium]|nr:DUF423 domain-containing protein [Anaerolineales bacterium]